MKIKYIKLTIVKDNDDYDSYEAALAEKPISNKPLIVLVTIFMAFSLQGSYQSLGRILFPGNGSMMLKNSASDPTLPPAGYTTIAPETSSGITKVMMRSSDKGLREFITALPTSALVGIEPITSSVIGDILVGTSSGWINLARGTDGQVLKTDFTLPMGVGWVNSGFTVGLSPGDGVGPIGTSTFATYGVYSNSGSDYLAFANSGTAQQSIVWKCKLPYSYNSGEDLVFTFEVGAAGASEALSFGLAIGTTNGVDLDTTAIATILNTAVVGDITTSGTQGVATTLTYNLSNAEADAAAAGDVIFIELFRRAPQDASTVTAYISMGAMKQ